MKLKDVLLALIVAITWGSNFIAVKIAISELPGFLALALRFLITGIVLIPYSEIPKCSFKEIYSISMIFGVFYIALLYLGMRLGLNSSLAVILMQLNIPLSVLIASITLKEQIAFETICGIIMAFMGMIIVVGTPHLNGNFTAGITVLLSAFFCALFNVESRKIRAKVTALSLLCWTSVISVPHLLIISYLLEGNPISFIENLSSVGWIATIYGSIIVGVIGNALWVKLLQSYPVNMVMPFNLLVPFFGVFFSITILKEELSWHIFLGGLITLFGIGVTQIKKKVK